MKKSSVFRTLALIVGLGLGALQVYSYRPMPINYAPVSRRINFPKHTANNYETTTIPSLTQTLMSSGTSTSLVPETIASYINSLFSPQEERDAVLDSIDEEIFQREAAIDQFAEEIAQTYGCPKTRTGILDLLYSAAAYIEDALHPQQYVGDMQLELSTILDDNLHLEDSNGSIASLLAWAQYGEQCLGAERGEVLNKYRDYYQSMEEGNCRQAEDIAKELDDVVRRLDSIRTCHGADEMYATLRRLSDDELAESARGLPPREYDRWRKACDYLRRHRDVPHEQAFVTCLADIALGSLEDKMATPSQLGVTSRDMEELISFLPTSDVQRVCALRTAVQQVRYIQRRTMVEPETYFYKCIEGE